MTSDLRNLIKSFKYFETLLKCSSGTGNTTYDNCVAKGDAEKALIEAFLDFSSYKNSPKNKRHEGLPPAFVKAIVHDLKTLKSLDPLYEATDMAYNSVPLNLALREIVWTDRGAEPDEVTEDEVVTAMGLRMDGGGLNKIITLSKKQQSGFVPYKVYQLAGSYTEDYLQKMNSKIRRYDNLFGGFKKVTKEITGSMEDLDTLLRTDLQEQIQNSLNKRYYKNYKTTNQTGGDGSILVKKLWKAYISAPQADREVFNSLANFMYREATTSGEKEESAVAEETGPDVSTSIRTSTFKVVTDFTMLTTNKEIRVNVLKSSTNYTYDRSGAPTKSLPLVVDMLPAKGNFRGLAIDYFKEKLLDEFRGLEQLLQNGGDTSAYGNVIPKDPTALDIVFSCDGKILDKLKKNEVSVDDVVYDFSTNYDRRNALHQNKWKLRDDGSFQKKNADGTFETFDPSEPKYREYFKSAEKCFNSYLSIDGDKCCDVIEKLIEGNGEDFMKKIATKDIEIGALDESFSKQNPYTIRQVLRSFKFPELAVWDPFVKGKLKKYPNFTYWVKNVLPNENLTPEERKTLADNTNLRDILNMCVSFVNHNVQILNPNVQPFEGTNMENKMLADRGVHRYRVEPNQKPKVAWDSSIKHLLRAVTAQQTPYSMFSSPLITSGVHFSMRGGGNDPKTGIVLNEVEVVPQFATNIAEDIKHLLNNLKSTNKTLRSSEMEKINKELNEFQALEIELYKKILTINKYIKIAYLMNDNNNEYVSLDKIRQEIANYTEYFKDYSAKDLELKNIGSFLRQYSKDHL